MPNGNNPAARLNALLLSARNQAPDTNARMAWSAVLSVQHTDTATLMRACAGVVSLAYQTRLLVQTYGTENPDLVLEQFHLIEGTVDNFANLDMAMSQFMNQYNDLADYCLRLCSALIDRYDAEPIAEEEAVTSLTDQVAALVRAVLDSDLDPAIKAWLVARLNEVELKLRHIKIYGQPGVVAALDELLGGAVRKPGWWVRVRQSPIWPDLSTVLAKLGDIARVDAAYRQLIAGDPGPLLEVLRTHVERISYTTTAPDEVVPRAITTGDADET